MLSKVKIKFIRSLANKRDRYAQRLFVAEGNKLVADTLPFFKCRLIVATRQWLNAMSVDDVADEVIVVSNQEISKASFLQSPQDVIAVYEMPAAADSNSLPDKGLILALDGVQDPGNMGTIIRAADWFGINTVLCSKDCADIFNPKTVQATMGALSRVNVVYVSLVESLLNIEMPVFGTFLDGKSIYSSVLDNNAVIVMGNEGKGISPEVEALVNNRIFIPPYPADCDRVESLNVAVATALTCAEFRRRIML